ncbi:MAG: PEP-CTERM sorting domain-containing protein [Planctomycetes bacterium]|nr:PEP-CTERM sorting domain-containing protein [Planctomycetota bacterium]
MCCCALRFSRAVAAVFPAAASLSKVSLSTKLSFFIPICVLGLVGNLVPVREASAVVIDFDNSSDLLLFNRRDEFQYNPMQWSSTGGVGNSGSLDVSSIHATTYSAESFGMTSVGQEIVVSTFFQVTDPDPAPGFSTNFGEVYLTTDPTGYPQASNTAFVSIRRDSSSDSFFGGALPIGGGSFSGFSVDFPKGTLLGGNWYELRVTYYNASFQTIGWEVDVNDYGADGLAFAGTVMSTSQTTSDGLGFTTDSTLYGGFATNWGGATAVDNFAVNPPPVGFSADFDSDVDVDDQDLSRWEGDFSINDDSDADGDGDSDGADFLAWQRQFGSGVAATSSAASVTVPEPRSMALVGLAVVAVLLRRRG